MMIWFCTSLELSKPKFDRFRNFFPFFFRPNFTFSIVFFSTVYPLDGFLAPWDPSQKKDLIFLRRMVPLRPLYDEIWPDSGQFKVPNFKCFGPIRKKMVWTSGEHGAEERKFEFVFFSFIFASMIWPGHQFPFLRPVIPNGMFYSIYSYSYKRLAPICSFHPPPSQHVLVIAFNPAFCFCYQAQWGWPERRLVDQNDGLVEIATKAS